MFVQVAKYFTKAKLIYTNPHSHSSLNTSKNKHYVIKLIINKRQLESAFVMVFKEGTTYYVGEDTQGVPKVDPLSIDFAQV